MTPSPLVVSETPASCGPRTVCDCAHHRSQETPAEVPGSRWAALAPILACAVCPACLATYAKVLAFLGVGMSLTETTHQLMLVVAVGVALVASAWKAWRLRRWGPLLVTALGCALLVAGHALDENPVLTWGGVAVLLSGGLWERQVWRRAVAPREARA
jgi:hypothetical protein